MLGNRIQQFSMDSGGRWVLNDVTGEPIRAWESRGHGFRTEYDPLRRPLRSFVTGADAANPGQELLTERLLYGEQHPEARRRNLRGKLYLHLDQAGSVTTEAYDFKGNAVNASRRVTNGTRYRQAMDWRDADADHAALPTDLTPLLDPVALDAALAHFLEADTYFSRTTYDALDRPVTLTTPHTPAMQPSTIRPGYNEANLLERVDVNLRGATANGQLVWTPFVTRIDYDSRGQRLEITSANGVTTAYAYDPLTFRPVLLRTSRSAAAFPGDCPQPPPAGWQGCQLQNLHYTYDPVGQITHIRDDAQQTIYFRNRRVEPSSDYRYDAIYQLIEATGREHLGQIGGAPISHSHDDSPRVGIDWGANDGNALGTYSERYEYDAVGNLLTMHHRGTDPVHPGWRRAYAYGEPSLLEDGVGGTLLKISNRLSATKVGANNAQVERYVYDAHGNMIRMPHLGGPHPVPNMHWDYRDQLRQTDVGSGTTYSVYDAAGQRVRKIWEKSATLTEERIYLGGFEIYRRRQGAQRLERETLHIMDDRQRIALVETRTLDTGGNDPAPQQLIRYQFGNHLGSASLELDAQARIISYEEYTPFGSTVYQAVRGDTGTPKRYRYTGKERDEESGLYYHGARYYAPWLGKWTSADPAGMVDGTNLYCYARNSPIVLSDPTGTDAEAPIGDVIKLVMDKILAARGPPVALAPAAEAAVPAVAEAALPAAAPGAAGSGLLMIAPVLTGAAILGAGFLTFMRSNAIEQTGNFLGVREPGMGILRYARPWAARPAPPAPEPNMPPAPDQELETERLPREKGEPRDKQKERERKPRPGRIYATYEKYNKVSNMYYVGRTSMVVDLNRPLRPQAVAAVKARDRNHHIDETDEPEDPAFGPARLDKFDIGTALNYDDRYNDLGYRAVRGREQQLLDYRGGAQSDTRPGPKQTENAIRAVGREHAWGRVFHDTATVRFGEELHRYWRTP